MYIHTGLIAPAPLRSLFRLIKSKSRNSLGAGALANFRFLFTAACEYFLTDLRKRKKIILDIKLWPKQKFLLSWLTFLISLTESYLILSWFKYILSCTMVYTYCRSAGSLNFLFSYCWWFIAKNMAGFGSRQSGSWVARSSWLSSWKTSSCVHRCPSFVKLFISHNKDWRRKKEKKRIYYIPSNKSCLQWSFIF